MLNGILANSYERGFRQLIEEVNLFRNEEDLWKTQGSVINPAGNLVLHIIGRLNHLIGTVLAQTGYVRNREQEFTSKGIEIKDLVAGLEALIPLVGGTINNPRKNKWKPNSQYFSTTSIYLPAIHGYSCCFI
ncbi:MAG: hypothetical protein ABI813_07705 [Bacteroidota bacterium]